MTTLHTFFATCGVILATTAASPLDPHPSRLHHMDCVAPVLTGELLLYNQPNSEWHNAVQEMPEEGSYLGREMDRLDTLFEKSIGSIDLSQYTHVSFKYWEAGEGLQLDLCAVGKKCFWNSDPGATEEHKRWQYVELEIPPGTKTLEFQAYNGIADYGSVGITDFLVCKEK